MTDWLNDMLDSDTPAAVPASFVESVMREVEPNAHQRRTSFMRASGFAVAASVMLALGIWIGQGSRSMSIPVDVEHDADMAAVDIDSIYANLEILDWLELSETDATQDSRVSIEVVDFALDILNSEDK